MVTHKLPVLQNTSENKTLTDFIIQRQRYLHFSFFLHYHKTNGEVKLKSAAVGAARTPQLWRRYKYAASLTNKLRLVEKQ